MKKIIILIMLAISCNIFAEEDPKTTQNKDNIEAKSQKKVPSTLSEIDKKIIESIRTYRYSIPPSLKSELKNFTEERRKINIEKRKLYDALTKEAKDALSEDSKLRKQLSPKAVKALKQILSDDFI